LITPSSTVHVTDLTPGSDNSTQFQPLSLYKVRNWFQVFALKCNLTLLPDAKVALKFGAFLALMVVIGGAVHVGSSIPIA
jgi:hypothetical protein